MTKQKATDRPVIVVGGGIGGLTAALALARRGWPVQVLEQARQFSEIGAGIQLGPNAMRVLAALGVLERTTPNTVFPHHLVLMDAISGELVTQVPLGPEFLARFKHPYGLIHRADLHSALMEACIETGCVQLRTSSPVKDLDDLGDRVRVTTSSGETTDAAAVIGADGLWSTVRQFVLSDGPPRISGHIAYRAVLPMDEVPEASRRNDMMAWAGPRTHLVHYPLHAANLLNLVAVFHSKRYQEGWDAYGDPEELTRSFAGQVPEVLNLLAKIDAWRMWVLCDRDPVKDWSRGRVTLLGDAAHPMLQYIAQGAAMSMEDAVCVAECVEAAGGDFAVAFAEYPRLRYLRTGRAQMTARLYGEVFHARDATREIRNAFLAPWGPEQHYQGMSWLYA